MPDRHIVTLVDGYPYDAMGVYTVVRCAFRPRESQETYLAEGEVWVCPVCRQRFRFHVALDAVEP